MSDQPAHLRLEAVWKHKPMSQLSPFQGVVPRHIDKATKNIEDDSVCGLVKWDRPVLEVPNAAGTPSKCVDATKISR